MFVTPDYYWGWVGGFLTGIAGTIISFLVLKGSEDVEEDSFSDSDSEENVDTQVSIAEDQTRKEKCPYSINTNPNDNIFYFKLSNESVKAVLSAEGNLVEKFANITDTEDRDDADEITKLLKEQLKRQKLDNDASIVVPEKHAWIETNLDIDHSYKAGTATPVFHTSKSGGYATFKDLDNAIKTYRENEGQGLLSRSEEREILNSFRDLVGQNYYDACNIANDRNYFLHPIYVGLKKTRERDYSGDVIGVRIKDEDLTYTAEGNPKPSGAAIITELIDIGGNDRFNRGALNL